MIVIVPYVVLTATAQHKPTPSSRYPYQFPELQCLYYIIVASERHHLQSNNSRNVFKNLPTPIALDFQNHSDTIELACHGDLVKKD